MSREEIRSEIRNFVQRRFAIPEDDPDFSEEIDLFNYGYIDSIGAVELITFVQREFKIEVAAADWAFVSLNSINAIASFVADRLQKEK